MNENLRQGINRFVKQTHELGMLDNDNLKDMVVCFKRVKGEYCDIVALQGDDKAIKNYDAHFEFPKLPYDDVEAMIDLAGALSVKLSNCVNGGIGGKAYSQSLSKEERQERARRAGQARWAKK